MSGGALLIVLLLAALALGIMTVFGAPLLAIPIILLLPGPLITLEFLRRQKRARDIHRFRRSARTKKTGFDARDRQTLSQ